MALPRPLTTRMARTTRSHTQSIKVFLRIHLKVLLKVIPTIFPKILTKSLMKILMKIFTAVHILTIFRMRSSMMHLMSTTTNLINVN